MFTITMFTVTQLVLVQILKNGMNKVVVILICLIPLIPSNSLLDPVFLISLLGVQISCFSDQSAVDGRINNAAAVRRDS